VWGCKGIFGIGGARGDDCEMEAIEVDGDVLCRGLRTRMMRLMLIPMTSWRWWGMAREAIATVR